MTVVRSKDEIPDEAYRKMVLTLMDKQASREVATAEVFRRWGYREVVTPTFEFSSDESGSTFQCSIDDAAFAACSSPFKNGR